MMAGSRVPVDLTNPGQVFACLGLMEAAERLIGPSEGRFDVRPTESHGTFVFETPDSGRDSPLEVILAFLRGAKVEAFAPRDSEVAVKEFGLPTRKRADCLFPSPRPNAPATLPILLVNGLGTVPIAYWADASSRDNVKFWGGSAGKSGAGFAADAIRMIRELAGRQWEAARENPFDVEAQMTGSLRFDWRRDYVPLALGFSLNKQDHITAVGYPFVELLAAIGLEHARPVRVDPRNKLAYRYAAWTEPLPTTLARCALGCPSSFVFSLRRLRMRLDWPGQEGQARCIVDAYEE